jgi:hypothetical protein
MQLVSHKVIVNAPNSVIWSELIHWETWTTWDGGMERVQFDGPIDVGSIGRLKMKDGPEGLLHISALQERVSYSDYFDLLGTRFNIHHSLSHFEELGETVHFSAEAQGPTAWILAPLIRVKMAKSLPQWMNTFKARCEQSAAGAA